MLKILSTNCFISPNSAMDLAIHKTAKEYGYKRGVELEHTYLSSGSVSSQVRVMKGFEAVIVGTEPFTPEMVEQLQPALKAIVRFGVGYDSVAINAATEYNVAVLNTPGANAQAVAEHTISLILALLKKIWPNHLNLNRSLWMESLGEELRGKTVGLIGFGKTAQHLIPILNAFSCRIVAHSHRGIRQIANELNRVEEVSLSDLIRLSDIISLHIPCNTKLEGFVNRSFFKKMKTNAYLINTSRGKLINENDLIKALNNGDIAGAGLDVFANEPLHESSPLLHRNDVVLSPHVAGSTVEAAIAVYKMAIDSIQKVFSEKESVIGNLLNPEIKFRYKGGA